MRAWQPTTALVKVQREKLEAEGRPAFIIADHNGMTGLFTFFAPGKSRIVIRAARLLHRFG